MGMTFPSEKPVKVLDVRGLYCPEPIYRAKQALSEMRPGEMLELISDDPVTEEDIPLLCRELGCRLLRTWRKGRRYHFLIER